MPSVRFAFFAVALTAGSLQPVSWACGPGYSKPAPFGRCRPDPGHSLLHGCSYRLPVGLLVSCLRRHGA